MKPNFSGPRPYVKLVSGSYDECMMLTQQICRALNFRVSDISTKDGNYVSFMYPPEALAQLLQSGSEQE